MSYLERMRAPDELSGILRKHGLKVTPQRRAIFEALSCASGHPTADVIWEQVKEQMPSVSLRTVYQALNGLVELGEIQSVSVGTGASRFDPNNAEHDHFVCDSCDRIYDVISSRPHVVSGYLGDAASDFRVNTAEVIFRGQCSSCPHPSTDLSH